MRLIDADKIPFFEAVNSESLKGTGNFYADKKNIDALPTIDMPESDMLKKYRMKVGDLETVISHKDRIIAGERHKNELKYRDGVIYGLKYALRCNGISGGDVS